MKIDCMAPDEWRRFRTIRLRALAEAPNAFVRTHAEEAAFPAEHWCARLSGQSATFVATRDGADIGMVTGAEWRGREGFAGLFGMWVSPNARGQGVGKGLVHAIIDWARSSGFQSLALDVADENRAAIELYQRSGFETTGSSGALPPPRDYITEHERVLTL